MIALLLAASAFGFDSEPNYDPGSGSSDHLDPGCTFDYCTTANARDQQLCQDLYNIQVVAQTMFPIGGGYCTSYQFQPAACYIDPGGCRQQDPNYPSQCTMRCVYVNPFNWPPWFVENSLIF